MVTHQCRFNEDEYENILEREDVLLLLVAVGDVAVAVGEVEQRLAVVSRRGVLGILVEAHLPFVQHAVQVDPRPAVVREGRRDEGEGEWRGGVWGRWRSGGWGEDVWSQ